MNIALMFLGIIGLAIIIAWLYGKRNPLMINARCPADGGRIVLVRDPDTEGAWFGPCASCGVMYQYDPRREKELNTQGEP